MKLLRLAGTLPLCLLLTSIPGFAAPATELALDETVIAQMETRAQHASPREQCFLYTELVHNMTMVAGQQLLAGEEEKASATLKRVERYATLIHMNLARDTRRLKQAEMLMHSATHNLAEFLHLLPPEQKASVQHTIHQLDQVNDELLAQVFAH